MRFLKFLALGLVLLAAGLRAEVADYYEGTTSGLSFAHTTAPTYTQWASLTPTTASTPIEVSAYDGVYLRISSTSGAGGVLVQFAEVSYTASAWVTEYRVGPNGNHTIQSKHAPWMRVVATNASGATTPSSTYVFARYALMSASSASTTSYAYLTTTAGGTAPVGGSQTAVAITGTVYTNITTAAGYNGPCQVCVYPGNGPGAAFYYLISPNSTWLAPATPLAVSTTPVCKNVGPGAHLFLSATAAAVTVNATVQYMPLR